MEFFGLLCRTRGQSTLPPLHPLPGGPETKFYFYKISFNSYNIGILSKTITLSTTQLVVFLNYRHDSGLQKMPSRIIKILNNLVKCQCFIYTSIILFCSVNRRNETSFVNAQRFGGSYNKLVNFVKN